MKKEIAENNQDVEGGPNGFKRFMCFLLMAVFIAMVIFLPQITDFINAKIAERNQKEISCAVKSQPFSPGSAGLHRPHGKARLGVYESQAGRELAFP